MFDTDKLFVGIWIVCIIVAILFLSAFFVLIVTAINYLQMCHV